MQGDERDFEVNEYENYEETIIHSNLEAKVSVWVASNVRNNNKCNKIFKQLQILKINLCIIYIIKREDLVETIMFQIKSGDYELRLGL